MSSIRTTFLIALAFFVVHSGSSAAVERMNADPSGEVSFIYLVPSDRSVSKAYPERISFAARHFQSWLGQRLNGKTFRLANPTVRIVQSDKAAKWFSSVERHTGYNAFYRNTLEELMRLGVAELNDPKTRYMVYVDADHACGQSGAGGGGLAVVSANDLRGLSGETIVPACEKANGAEIAGRCRWIGGMGHEMLHTLGLIHPDRSPACQTAQCRSEALMLHGYVKYPNAALLEEESLSLNRSPFVQEQRTENPPDCTIP